MTPNTSTPLPFMTFKHWDLDDREVGVLLVKATCHLRWTGSPGASDLQMRGSNEQPEIVSSDQPFAALDDKEPLGGASTRVDQEIAPFKQGADIIVTGSAKAPNDANDQPRALADWPVRVAIYNGDGTALCAHSFHVCGPNAWRPTVSGWRTSKPVPVLQVPLRYELAYGGSVEVPGKGDEPPTIECFAFNPVGRGWLGPKQVRNKRLASDEPIPAPQIGDLAELTQDDIDAELRVMGTAPIAKHWLPRRSYAGSFDQEWLDLRHPRMPRDYSKQFWHSAPSALQTQTPLRGDETLSLVGLSHRLKTMRIRLPGIEVRVHKDAPDGPFGRLSLDTLHLELADSDSIEAHRVTLLWRGVLEQPDQAKNLHMNIYPLEANP